MIEKLIKMPDKSKRAHVLRHLWFLVFKIKTAFTIENGAGTRAKTIKGIQVQSDSSRPKILRKTKRLIFKSRVKIDKNKPIILILGIFKIHLFVYHNKI